MWTPGKFLKAWIFAGISLRKFPWLVGVDFSATVLPPACWWEPWTFCFSGLWDFSLGVQVKESSCELRVAANCHAFGKTLRGENGRDLKAVFDCLELGGKIERSVAAVVGRWKISPVASAVYLRALSEMSSQKVLAETNGQLGGNAVTLCRINKLPECLPKLVNQTETINMLLCKFMVW